VASANDTPAMLAQSACLRPESFGRDERDLAVRGGGTIVWLCGWMKMVLEATRVRRRWSKARRCEHGHVVEARLRSGYSCTRADLTVPSPFDCKKFHEKAVGQRTPWPFLGADLLGSHRAFGPVIIFHLAFHQQASRECRPIT